MTNKQMSLRAAMLMGVALPATAAVAQYTGTSRPEQVPITTSDDGVRQPVVYVSASVTTPAATLVVSAPELTPRSLPPVAAPPVATVQMEQPNPDAIRERAIFSDGNAAAFAGPEARAAAPVAAPPDVDANFVARAEGLANRISEGTLIRTKLLQDLSTHSTVEGAEWQAEMLEPLVRDGHVLIPAGALIRGKVTEVHGGRRISGQASIHLQPLALLMPDGTSLGVHAQVIDTSLYHSTRVDREGTIFHREHRKQQAAVLALTTGSGAAAGAVLGGVPGALVGAGIGAGVSTALWLKQDRQAELPRDTELTFELTKGMAVGLE